MQKDDGDVSLFSDDDLEGLDDQGLPSDASLFAYLRKMEDGVFGPMATMTVATAAIPQQLWGNIPHAPRSLSQPFELTSLMAQVDYKPVSADNVSRTWCPEASQQARQEKDRLETSFSYRSNVNHGFAGKLQEDAQMPRGLFYTISDFSKSSITAPQGMPFLAGLSSTSDKNELSPRTTWLPLHAHAIPWQCSAFGRR